MTDALTLSPNDSRPVLRTELADRFVADGFVVVEDLVSREELTTVIADAARFARGEYRVLNPPALPEGASDEEALQQILAIHFPHWVSDVARSMIQHPGIVDVLRQITGAHLPHWDGSVKCCQSILFVKGPGMPGQAWHQDERYIPTRDRSLVGAWIALDDATLENGCLEYGDGTNLGPVYAHEAPPGEPFNLQLPEAILARQPMSPAPVRRGGVSFHHGNTFHRCAPNHSTRWRRAVALHYVNHRTFFERPALPYDHALKLRVSGPTLPRRPPG